MRHLSACPKKTLIGSDAAKSEPVIICPMYANESCSIGMIFVNAECEKPHQVTTGASLVSDAGVEWVQSRMALHCDVSRTPRVCI